MKHYLSYLCLIFAFCEVARAQVPVPPQESTVNLEEAALRSPAVAAILDSPHEEPADALDAVLTLINLREFEVANELFKTVTGAGLNPAEQAAFVKQFGTAKFLQLAREGRAHGIAGAAQFADQALAAAAEEAAKPENLTRLINDLKSDDPATRQAARSDLAATGLPAAQACLEALATATDKTERSHLLAAIVEISPVVDPLLIASIADGRGHFRRDVAELAGHLHQLEAVPWLATIAAGADADPDTVATAQATLAKMSLSLPNYDDAIAVVRRELERIDAGIPTDSFPNELGLWWMFDPATNKFTSVELISCERRSLIHARTAANFLVLPTATEADRQLAIISAIEAAHILGKPPTPEIANLAKSLTTDNLNAALNEALKTNRVNAAIACAKLLGERADLAALSSLDGNSTPLAQAVAHGNRELKFAALEAIMKINPPTSYPGASYVPETLWLLAQGAGTPQAVIGAPVMAHANDWAGNLRGLGFEAIPTTTGIEIIEQATAAPRVAYVLVDSDIGRPLVRETIYQLRAQPRLARVPIAILMSNEDLLLGEQLAATDSRILAVSRPRSADAMKSIVDRLGELSDPELSADEKNRQAVQAVEWLGQLFGSGAPYDELLRDAPILEQAIYNPTLSQTALLALAHVGTAGSQRNLVDFASLESQPLELRKIAVESFAKNREQFGVLLSAAEIALQYDRYNASETASAETQQVLGAVLDILEKKSN